MRASNSGGHSSIFDDEALQRVAPGRVIAEKKSQYSDLLVVENPETRYLATRLGSHVLLHCAVRRADGFPVAPYLEAFVASSRIFPRARQILNIGYGGGVLPSFYLSHFDVERIESVEVDPVIIELVQEHFPLNDGRHVLRLGDGLASVREGDQAYDLVWIDAGQPSEGILPEFFSESFIDALKKRLSPEGAVITNVFGPVDGEQSVAAYLRAFKNVILIRSMSFNQVLAASDSNRLTCEGFWSAYDALAEAKLIDFGWKPDPTSRSQLCLEFRQQAGARGALGPR